MMMRRIALLSILLALCGTVRGAEFNDLFARQAADDPVIVGGTINGSTIGGTDPEDASFLDVIGDTFTADADPYDGTWSGSLKLATQDDVYDKIQAVIAGGGLGTNDIDTSAELLAIITDENGTGAILFSGATSAAFTSPALTTPTITGAITFADDTRQTFNPGATNAGLNIGSQAGDPSGPSNGDLWYDSVSNELTARINGANVALGAAGGGLMSTDIDTSAELRGILGDESGTGAAIFAGGAIGAATATSVNGLTLTSSTGTLTIANSKTLTSSNTLTLTATDGSTLAIGAGGTLGTAAYTASSAYQAVDTQLTGLAALGADPNADRGIFWDDSAGAFDYWATGNGLSFSTTNLVVDSASTTVDGILEIATTGSSTDEVETGTDTARAVTPAGVKNAIDARRLGKAQLAAGLKGYFLDGLGYAGGDTSTRTANSLAMRARFGEGADAGWADRQELVLPADFYFVNTPTHFAARVGIPNMRGQGGEPTYHPMTQYGTGAFYSGTEGQFTASSYTFTASASDSTAYSVTALALPTAWAYITNETSGLVIAVGRVVTPTNGSPDTIVLEATPLYGTYADLALGNCTCTIYGAKGGPVTAFVWDDENDSSHNQGMFNFYGYGGRFLNIHGFGKQGDNGTTLIQDSASADYPHASPSGAHPSTAQQTNEDRCRYFITMNSTQALGSGKVEFDVIAPVLFQTGIYISESASVLVDHGDQCEIERFAPAFCDVGIHNNQRQAFSWHIHQTELVSTRWGYLFDAGGKWWWDTIDMGEDCDIAIFIRGDDQAASVGPDEYRVTNHINIDESSPDDAMILKVDPSTSGYSSASTHFEGAHIPAERYYSESTYDDGSSIPAKGYRRWRGEAVYDDTACDWNAATRTVTYGANTTLAGITVGDWVEFRLATDTLKDQPYVIGKVESVDDGANTFVVETGPQYGTFPGGLSNTLTVHVYNGSTEKPIVELRDDYGYHEFRNIRNAFPRMIRYDNDSLTGDGTYGTGKFQATIVLDGGTFGTNTLLHRGTTTADLEATIADIFTTDSEGWVVVTFQNFREGIADGDNISGSNSPDSGQPYPNIRAYGELDGEGGFTADTIQYWPD